MLYSLLVSRTRRTAAPFIALVALAAGAIVLAACAPTPASEPPVTISVGIFDRGEIPVDEGTMGSNRWTRLINERIEGVEVEFRAYPRRDILDMWDLELAVNAAPDLMSIYWGVWLQQKAYSGYVLGLDGLVEQFAPNYLDHVGREFVREYGTVEGELYLLPSRRENTAQDVIWIREDWLENLGLTVPVTLDGFRELIRAFAFDDPNRSGTDDTYGAAFNHRLIDLIFAAHGVRYGSVVNPYNIRGGQIVLAHEIDGFWPAVAVMREIYEEGGIDPDFIQPGYDNRVHLLAYDGELGIFAKNIDWGRRLLYATREHTPESDWVVADLFRSDHGRHPYLETYPASITGIVNARTAHPEAVLKFVDFQADTESLLLLTHGVRDRHYRLVDGIPIEIDPELNRHEQHYARNSSYFILRGPGIGSSQEATKWALRATDPVLRRGYELQADALSLLGRPYDFEPLVLPMYLPTTSEYHDELKQFLEAVVIKSIVGGNDYSLDDARVELLEGLAERRYEAVRTELSEGYRKNAR